MQEADLVRGTFEELVGAAGCMGTPGKRVGEVFPRRPQSFRHQRQPVDACSPRPRGRVFKSLSRTVTCTRELIRIYMRYSQGDGINNSLSRLSYLVLYTVVQLSSCTLFLYGTKYPKCWTLMMNDI